MMLVQPLSSRPGRGQLQRQTRHSDRRGPGGGTSPNAESSQPRSQGHDTGKFSPLPPFSEAGRGGGCGMEVDKASGPGCRGEGPRSTFPHPRPTRDAPRFCGLPPTSRLLSPLPLGGGWSPAVHQHTLPLCVGSSSNTVTPLCAPLGTLLAVWVGVAPQKALERTHQNGRQ